MPPGLRRRTRGLQRKFETTRCARDNGPDAKLSRPHRTIIAGGGIVMTAEALLPRLYERDIDVLLQEELIFNEAVCERLAAALGFKSPLRVSQCALSVVDGTG